MATTEWPSACFTKETQAKVSASNILMIGAGGIGCELIKTLVLTGFRNITMIDMDTIDISNLNRQFLFRKRHVGMSKASVAADTVRAFCPSANIKTLQDNVKESQFDPAFFKKFDMVLNGLDNDEARRHVNRLCLAAEVPLVESGTMGYKGQVSVHLKDETECFECRERPKPKGFPVCTIRNTPEQPIHCVVWAKDMLFQRLFGPRDVVTDLDEAKEDDASKEDDAEAEAAASDPSEYLRNEGEDAWEYAIRIFKKIYSDDIQRLLKVERLWEKRAPPKPLDLDTLLPDLVKPASCANPSAAKALSLNPRDMWSVETNARLLLHSIYMYHENRASDVGSAVFDKDDDLAVEMVTASSNLRSHCYGIDLQTEFTVKGMAGNIIHAIATTNAIISGLIVIEAVKLIAMQRSACRAVFLTGEQPNQYGKIGTASTLLKPSPKCMVCQQAIVSLSVDTSRFTFGQLINKVIKGAMAFNSPSVQMANLEYIEGDDLDEEEVAENAAYLPFILSALPGGGITHNTSLHVLDQTQDLKVTLVVLHKELNEEEHPAQFVMEGSRPAVDANAESSKPAKEAPAKEESDDDDFCVVGDDVAAAGETSTALGSKRKRSGSSGASTNKQPRVVAEDDLVCID